MIKQKSRRIAVVLIILASIISGTNTPIIRQALLTIPTPLFGLLRLAIPLILLTPVMLLTKRKKIKLRYIAVAMVFGLLMYVAGNGLSYLGLKRSSAVNAAAIGLLQPLFMFTFSVQFMREKFNAQLLLGIGIAFVGSILVVFGPLIAHQHITFNGSVLGNLLLAGGVLSTVGANWVAKIGLERIDKLQLLFWSLLPGVAIFAFLSVGQWGQIASIFENRAVASAVLFGALGNGLLSYIFCFYALKQMEGKEYSIFEYIDPAAAAIVSVLFFGENFTPLLLGGVIIISSGLYLAEARRHKTLNLRPYLSKN